MIAIWANGLDYSRGISKCVWEVRDKTTEFCTQSTYPESSGYSWWGRERGFKHALHICRIKRSFIKLQITLACGKSVRNNGKKALNRKTWRRSWYTYYIHFHDIKDKISPIK